MMLPSAFDVAGLIEAVTPRLARLATPAMVGTPAGAESLAQAGEAGAGRDAERGRVLRRGLEEWGVRCRESAELTVLEAFGLVSARGVEVTVATDLTPREQALAYARCVVRLAFGDGQAFATWFDYRAGQVPAHETPEERRAAAVVDAMARALLAGRLEAAPRYLLPSFVSAAAPEQGQGLLGGCSRALLGGLHRASSALYWHSDSYQVLRASAPMVRLTARVHALLSAQSSPRAA